MYASISCTAIALMMLSLALRDVFGYHSFSLPWIMDLLCTGFFIVEFFIHFICSPDRWVDYLRSCRVATHDVKSHHVMTHDVTSFIVSGHVLSRHVMTHDLMSGHVMSCHVRTHDVTPFVMLCRVISRRVMTHHVMPFILYLQSW